MALRNWAREACGMLRNVRFYPTITLRSGSSSQGLLVTDVTTAIAMEPGLGMIWMLAVFNASLLNASSSLLRSEVIVRSRLPTGVASISAQIFVRGCENL